MIINESYFRNSISVPGNSVQTELLNDYIDLTESDILLKMLGRTLYNEYLNDLDSDGNPVSEKWIALVDGHEYTYNGYYVKWEGLRNEKQESLLAYFTFENLLRDDESTYSTSGTVRGNSDKSTVINSGFKMHLAHNKGVELYGNVDPYRGCLDQEDAPTAYNFLMYSEFDFNGLRFTPIGKINFLGL